MSPKVTPDRSTPSSRDSSFAKGFRPACTSDESGGGGSNSLGNPGNPDAPTDAVARGGSLIAAVVQHAPTSTTTASSERVRTARPPMSVHPPWVSHGTSRHCFPAAPQQTLHSCSALVVVQPYVTTRRKSCIAPQISDTVTLSSSVKGPDLPLLRAALPKSHASLRCACPRAAAVAVGHGGHCTMADAAVCYCLRTTPLVGSLSGEWAGCNSQHVAHAPHTTSTTTFAVAACCSLVVAQGALHCLVQLTDIRVYCVGVCLLFVCGCRCVARTTPYCVFICSVCAALQVVSAARE